MKYLIHCALCLFFITISCKKNNCDIKFCLNESQLNESNCSCNCSLWYSGETCDKDIKYSYFGTYRGTYTEREKNTINNVQWRVANYGKEKRTFKIILPNDIEWYCTLNSPTEFDVYWDNLDDYAIKGSGIINEQSLSFRGEISRVQHKKESKTKLSFIGSQNR